MKDLKISKELIKAVLQKETEILSKDFNFTINEDYIEFSDDGEIQFEYCIYKFAFKCKEWALSNGHYLKSRGVNILCKESMPKCEVEYIDKNNMFVSKDFYSNTETEAIIKACTYILNNLSNK